MNHPDAHPLVAGDLPARVLVTLDGSPRSADAIPVGVALADRFGIAVSYLTVAAGGTDLDAARAACERFVPGERLEGVIARDAVGDIARIILSLTDDGPEPVLRCMASRGRGAVRGALFGRVAEQVVREGRTPTVVVGPGFDPLRFAGIERLLVCTDGSPTSEQVVPLAIQWALRAGLELEFLTVRPHATEQRIDTVRPSTSEEYLRDLDDTEAADVRRLAETLSDGGLRPSWRVLRDDDPAAAITSYARRRPDSLLVMHTHGRRGAGRRRFGEVTLRVVQASPVPVLLSGPSAAVVTREAEVLGPGDDRS